nr:response regulator [Paraburkholderia nodosa]
MTVWLPAVEAAGETGAAALPAGSLSGVRAMIVLDDPDTAASLGKLLELEGASTVMLAGADTVLAALEAEVVDVLICDVGSSGIDAATITAHLRSDPRLANLRSVAVTANDTEANRRAARETGFDAHVSKPVDFQTLVRVLRDLLPALRR